jgi:ABC-type transporter Mla subunit MlaD
VSPLLSDLALLRRVGAIAIAVLALAIGAFMFADGITLRSPTRIRVLFRHSAGLRERAPLVVAGHAIGRVETISPIAPRAAPHGRALGDEVAVAVTVAIDASRAWQVPARAEIFVASRGPISDRFLEVAPPSGEPGPPITDGAELRGVDPPSLDGVLQHTWTHLTVFRDFTQAVAPELTALRRELDRLRAELDALDRDLHAAGASSVDSVDDPHGPMGIRALIDATKASIDAGRHTRDVSLGGELGVAHLRATLTDAREVLGELHATIDRIMPLATALTADGVRVRDHVDRTGLVARAGQAIDRARMALERIDPLVAILDEIARRITNGEGSVLRLIRDPEFPEDAKDLGKVIKRHPWRILEHAPRD